jgi:molybdopterin molybdotransferase
LEPPIPAFIVKTEQSPVEKGVHSDEASLIASFPAGMDIFRAGKITSKWQPGLEIELIRDHSPSKISPFLDSDCWIHIHRGQTELHHGDTVDVFLMT